MKEGGDAWDFVFNNYLARGLNVLVDAIEVCSELVDIESPQWTWEQCLKNLPELSPTKYHTVLTSQRFIYRWCTQQGIDVWKFAEQLADEIDMRQQKINCFILHGQSNSGKTMLMKSVFESFRLGALVTNGTSVGFTWQHALEKRIILNEECLIAATHTGVQTNNVRSRVHG